MVMVLHTIVTEVAVRSDVCNDGDNDDAAVTMSCPSICTVATAIRNAGAYNM